MKLSMDQIAFYHENGYLLIEDYLQKEEVEALQQELPNTIEVDSPRIILEDNGSVRSVFAPHFVSDTYSRLSRLDRFVIPAEQLIGNKVYLHQYKINSKKGLKGEWWEWHQDFPYWHIEDGIKDPDMISIMLYLQDTDPSNGALMLIPKSHKLGIVTFALKDPVLMTEKTANSGNHQVKDYLSSLNSNLKFTVDHNLLKEMSIQHGIVTASGKKGSVLFFHGNTFHASNTNLTPFDRDAVLITYNSVSNTPGNKDNPRPEFLVSRNYDPIVDLEVSI